MMKAITNPLDRAQAAMMMSRGIALSEQMRRADSNHAESFEVRDFPVDFGGMGKATVTRGIFQDGPTHTVSELGGHELREGEIRDCHVHAEYVQNNRATELDFTSQGLTETVRYSTPGGPTKSIMRDESGYFLLD